MSDQKGKAPTPTRKRASTPRSKTGCITCKIRRLKCDEEKPRCLRCVKSGWQCDGYEHNRTGESSSSTGTGRFLLPATEHVPLRPRSRSPHSPTPSRSPSSNRRLDEQEEQYFQKFVEEQSTNIVDQDAFIWRDLALQESHTNSCVRHAIVAIGALSTSTQKSLSGLTLMDGSNGYHREFALQQYQKAIRSLRESIGDMDTPDSSRKTLISCLVLAFFDNFIGNGGFAVQHLRYARNILLNSAPLRMPPSSPHPQNAEDALAYMVLCLEYQDITANGISDSRVFVALESIQSKVHLPEQFNDLAEARSYSLGLRWEGYHFWYRTAYCNFIPREAIPLDIQEDRVYLIEQIHQYHSRVERLMLAAPPDYSSHPLLRASSIKYNTVILLLRLTLSLNNPETEADNHLHYFEYILSIARDVIEYEMGIESPTGSSPSSDFPSYHLSSISLPQLSPSEYPNMPFFIENEVYTFEVRTIDALFLVATKCRSSPLRHQAISLMLSSHRREWMCSSLIAGQVAAWMTSLEEQGMDEIGYIPEEKRAWGECLEIDLQRRTALVKCKLGTKGTNDWGEMRTEISW
ncbi:putative transcriptional regulatory protein [Lachnellula arida]|uniref:Putative transcriptional regulatory protein n=1 Tax=Lachnellula arida TaxID=1316785 RepID=A0A8T9B2N1_9HELO|nr:putative transcriptional regulatory protein [Lachnellula arida]